MNRRAGWQAVGRCWVWFWFTLAESAVGTVVVVAVLLLPTGLGFRLMPRAAMALRRLSDRARGWCHDWSGVAVSQPAPLPTDPALSARSRGRAILADEGFWRDLRWATLTPLLGGLLLSVPGCLIGYGAFGVLVQPLIWQALGDGNWYAFIPVVDTVTAIAAVLLGLGFIASGVWCAPAVLGLHARWNGRLLAAPRSVELARRVEQLADSRAEALDAQAAELRRIERDLHDGAQARLVALGMTVDNATRVLESDPDTARRLLRQVRETSMCALADLRDLVHGIHPPVLADRGLGDAVRSVALDSPLDITVDVRLPGRLPLPVESAAYFAVNELLTNATKHAGARTVAVTLAHNGHALRVTARDDGRGGADPTRGTGLRGVERRLAAFDGTLALHSPLGGPTTATLEIPCALSSPKTSSSSGTDWSAP
ncbi:sensor histidine kinase [Actinosynnema sp. ALI-1.44]|uniref:sensor histidine kinase n=1 Tax=Actinosynnema sp. ALI-1.44 TaxID=1933779 RepID=UPI00097BD333|nr:sensor domain-containing protein [Actinosynnema sp. ALI-1.44]ONI79509.1 sensor histidine kinase [Actinosynnema sp. ALI-1.44]